MATHYIAKFPSTASFLAASPDNGAAEGFGFVDDVLYANIGGSAVPVAGKVNSEVVITTNVIAANESDKTFYLSLATGFVSTLPAPAAGLKYTFIVKTAPSGGTYTIVTKDATETLFGKIISAAGDAGDVENTGGGTTITFADGQAVVGDKVVVESDGTNWYVLGHASVAAGITITG